MKNIEEDDEIGMMDYFWALIPKFDTSLGFLVEFWRIREKQGRS